MGRETKALLCKTKKVSKDDLEKLKEAMENNNVTKLEFGELKVSYRNASTRTAESRATAANANRC